MTHIVKFQGILYGTSFYSESNGIKEFKSNIHNSTRMTESKANEIKDWYDKHSEFPFHGTIHVIEFTKEINSLIAEKNSKIKEINNYYSELGI